MKGIRQLKKKHWYVRLQAYLLLAQIPLLRGIVQGVRKEYDLETNLEVRRGMISPLCQLDADELKSFIRIVSFDPNLKIGRLGRMLLDLYTHKDSTIDEINSLFHNYDEIRLMDSLYKLEVIKHHEDPTIKDMLRRSLKMVRNRIRRPLLRSRVDRIVAFLG
jgi:hypothetical protein